MWFPKEQKCKWFNGMCIFRQKNLNTHRSLSKRYAVFTILLKICNKLANLRAVQPLLYFLVFYWRLLALFASTVLFLLSQTYQSFLLCQLSTLVCLINPRLVPEVRSMLWTILPQHESNAFYSVQNNLFS